MMYVKTPLWPLRRINQKSGKNFLIKLESFQPIASFKIRGVSKLVEQVQAEGYTRIVCGSGGNSGYAAAYCARLLGMNCTVVVPRTAGEYMAQLIRQEGATVITHGDVFDEAKDLAVRIAGEDQTSFFMHSFDQPTLWEGHSTIVDELAQQTDKPDAIVLSVGGGGLLNGVIQGMDRNGWADVPVIAVEMEGAPKFYKAREVGYPVMLDKITTIATTLAGKTVSQQSLDYAKTHNIVSYLINDKSAAIGVSGYLEDFRMIVELACGASMSVAYELPEVIAPYQNVVVIACGGAGVNLPLLLEYKRLFSI